METRLLPMPESGAREFTVMRTYWGAFDHLTQRCGLTVHKIMAICREEVEISGVDIDTVFRGVVAHLDHKFTKQANEVSTGTPDQRPTTASRFQIEELERKRPKRKE